MKLLLLSFLASASDALTSFLVISTYGYAHETNPITRRIVYDYAGIYSPFLWLPIETMLVYGIATSWFFAVKRTLLKPFASWIAGFICLIPLIVSANNITVWIILGLRH